jgi:hypothetical protein
MITHAIWLKVAIGAVVIWLLFRGKAQASTGVIQGEGPDFDPVTADQLNAARRGEVTVGDDWSATFITENGNWSDAYRSHANEEPGGIP